MSREEILAIVRETGVRVAAHPDRPVKPTFPHAVVDEFTGPLLLEWIAEVRRVPWTFEGQVNLFVGMVSRRLLTLDDIPADMRAEVGKRVPSARPKPAVPDWL